MSTPLSATELLASAARAIKDVIAHSQADNPYWYIPNHLVSDLLSALEAVDDEQWLASLRYPTAARGVLPCP